MYVCLYVHEDTFSPLSLSRPLLGFDLIDFHFSYFLLLTTYVDPAVHFFYPLFEYLALHSSPYYSHPTSPIESSYSIPFNVTALTSLLPSFNPPSLLPPLSPSLPPYSLPLSLLLPSIPSSLHSSLPYLLPSSPTLFPPLPPLYLQDRSKQNSDPSHVSMGCVRTQGKYGFTLTP